MGPRLERVDVLIIETLECNILFLFKPSVNKAPLFLIAWLLELLRLSFLFTQAAKIPLSSELGIDEFHFNDFSLDNDAMITASLRMFLELGVVQKFKIDYEVRSSVGSNRDVCLMESIQHLNLFFASGAVPVAAHREEELPHRSLPQLETCLQRLAVHVCHDHRESSRPFKPILSLVLFLVELSL